MDFKLDAQEMDLLESIGISIFDESRNYWFVRTQGGDYYNDFVNENFIGIEWDEISDIDFIKNSSEEVIKREVSKFYPKVEKPGSIVSKILMFVKDMKKGDIVLIPSENSKWISFGEVIEDEINIYEEDEEEFQILLDDFYDNTDNNKKKSILKKRRNVRWINKFKRKDLDLGLQGIIYNPSAIFSINVYSLLIDRTLSQFYIKGEEAYFTYKVNKKNNIPYQDLISFLNSNNKLIEYINKNVDDEFKIENLILKINVQSKGPIQFKDKVKTILILGLIITGLFGADFKFKVSPKDGLDCKISTEGLPKLLETVFTFIDKKEDKELLEMKKSLNESGEKLQISTPKINSKNKDEEITVDNDNSN